MPSIKQAVILAGGQGIRLRPLTYKIPKPMIRFYHKPFLGYLIELLKKNGIKEVVILTGYLHEKIEDYFKDGKKWGVAIKYSFSPPETDTGQRIKNAEKLIADEFLLLYGDNYWPLNLKKHEEYFRERNVLGMVTIYRNLDIYTKNNIFVNEKGYVEIYDETKKNPLLNGVDIGFFIFKKEILKYLPKTNSHFESWVLPKLIQQKQLAGFLTNHKYYGLSNIQRIPQIKAYFRPKKIIFLDRDGVINKKPPKAHYVTAWKDFIWLPQAKKVLKLLSKKNYYIYIISNQAGIGRGLVTRKKVEEINSKMKKELKKLGIKIDDIYICPHGWDEGCYCRKPKPGLFFKASYDHHLNLFQSSCIGDDKRDIMAGKESGCKTYLVTKKNTFFDIVKKLK